MIFQCITLLATISQDPKPIDMRVLSDGQAIGTATFQQKLLSDGGKHIIISLSLKPAKGDSVQVRQESVYDRQAYPVRMIQETLTGEGKRKELRVATFDEMGAEVEITKDGKTSSKLIDLTKGAPRWVRSEFWFIRDMPSKGDRATYYVLDIGEMRWKLTESIYTGDVDLDLQGRKVRAHRVSSPPSTAYLDDQGWPLVLEIGKIKLERL